MKNRLTYLVSFRMAGNCKINMLKELKRRIKFTSTNANYAKNKAMKLS